MSKLELEVGDIVAETYQGYYSHKEFHGQNKLEARVMGVPVELPYHLRRPGFLWRARKGEVIEVQARWWNQDGYDVLVRWKNGGEPEWRLADSEHLRLIKRAKLTG